MNKSEKNVAEFSNDVKLAVTRMFHEAGYRVKINLIDHHGGRVFEHWMVRHPDTSPVCDYWPSTKHLRLFNPDRDIWFDDHLQAVRFALTEKHEPKSVSLITAKDSVPPWERDRSVVRPVQIHEQPPKQWNGFPYWKKKKESKAARKARKAKQLAERLQELARMPYHEYLASPEWKAKRKKVIRRAKGKCEDCGAQKRLEVHHLRYSRRGTEPLADLKCICRFCHSIRHEDKHPAEDAVSKEFRQIASWF